MLRASAGRDCIEGLAQPGRVHAPGIPKHHRARGERIVTNSRFTHNLVLKGRRALLTARVALQIGDSDSAVSRSYYAMFDIARAALLKAGLSEDKLPRTHSGVIDAFGRYAIESGKIDVELAGGLSRTEALRMQADCTDTPVNARSGADAVAQAESFFANG